MTGPLNLASRSVVGLYGSVAESCRDDRRCRAVSRGATPPLALKVFSVPINLEQAPICRDAFS